jgi:hypothetical protein
MAQTMRVASSGPLFVVVVVVTIPRSQRLGVVLGRRRRAVRVIRDGDTTTWWGVGWRDVDVQHGCS